MKEDIKENRAARIVEIAENVFFEKGYSKTTISDICKAVKCSRTTLYTYFDTKENIYLSVVNRSFEIYFKYLQKLEVQDSEGLARILCYVQGYFDFCKESPKRYALIMDFYFLMKGISSKKLQSDAHLEIANSSNFSQVETKAKLLPSVLIQEIENGQKDGSIDTMKPAPILFMNIWSYLFGVTALSDFGRVADDGNYLDVEIGHAETNAMVMVKDLMTP